MTAEGKKNRRKDQESSNHGAQKTNRGRRRGGRKNHTGAKMWNEYMAGNPRTREETTGNEMEDAEGKGERNRR